MEGGRERESDRERESETRSSTKSGFLRGSNMSRPAEDFLEEWGPTSCKIG